MLTATRRKTIGPSDHGRKMSLKAFEFVETEEGFHYELSRGFITVSQVANLIHALLVAMLRDALSVHKALNPDQVYIILGGMECKLLIPEWESERHPDIAVYLTKPKGPKNDKLWRRWTPELVIEVVSERSSDRDYVAKREEYWTLGAKEYWIVDAKRHQVVVLRRGKSDWIENWLDSESTLATKLLPGFKLPCKAIMEVVAGLELDEE